MHNIIFKVLTSWQVVLISGIFITVLLLLFPVYEKKLINKMKNKNKPPRKDQFSRTINPESNKLRKEEPGKLYVPDSTYEVLKKEKLVHPPD